MEVANTINIHEQVIKMTPKNEREAANGKYQQKKSWSLLMVCPSNARLLQETDFAILKVATGKLPRECCHWEVSNKRVLVIANAYPGNAGYVC